MAPMKDTAAKFFDACETGKGWAGCREYCQEGATFSAQTGALAGIDTLEQYTDWMQGLLTILPDGSYEVRSFAVDEERGNVAAYGVFRGTHTGEGGPVPPTGKRAEADYLCHAVRRRSLQSHDQDLERHGQPPTTRLELRARRAQRGVPTALVCRPS
jgi:predicted ester cyclase